MWKAMQQLLYQNGALPLTCLRFSELSSPNDKVQGNCFLKLIPG